MAKLILERYEKASKSNWTGRIDSESDSTQFRLHQNIQLLDLTKDLDPATGSNCFSLMGFACDEGVIRNQGRPGAKEGPLALRKALASLPAIQNRELSDAGQITCSDQGLEKTQKEFGSAIHQLLKAGYKPIGIGGGHSISWGHIQGLSEFTAEPIGIINFDAHFDLRPYENSQSSSGTPFLQALDFGKSKNRDFGYHVIGIQNFSNSASLFETAQSYSVTHSTTEDINNSPLERSWQELCEQTKDFQHLYVTFCLDCLPASVAPGVSAPNPLGLDPSKTFELLKRLFQSGKVLSFDIAELSPTHDTNSQTAKIAAMLAFLALENWQS